MMVICLFIAISLPPQPTCLFNIYLFGPTQAFLALMTPVGAEAHKFVLVMTSTEVLLCFILI